MCTTCGCDFAARDHDHGHDHDHHHDHDHTHDVVLNAPIDVLAKSQALAEANRRWLRAHGVTMFNVMSSPGAGKTTLLARTVQELRSAAPVFVIEGDQATSFDADRIRAAGARAVQVNTGAGCHLDPHMIRHALEELAPSRGSLVIVENVGNLVCPAMFDLGESERIVIASTPEGDDKPLKYPHMFQTATLAVLNKIDLLGIVPFDAEKYGANVARMSPRAERMNVSALSGAGLAGWYSWIGATIRRSGATS